MVRSNSLCVTNDEVAFHGFLTNDEVASLVREPEKRFAFPPGHPQGKIISHGQCESRHKSL